MKITFQVGDLIEIENKQTTIQKIDNTPSMGQPGWVLLGPEILHAWVSLTYLEENAKLVRHTDTPLWRLLEGGKDEDSDK